MTEAESLEQDILQERRFFVTACIIDVIVVQSLGLMFGSQPESHYPILFLNLASKVFVAYLFYRFSRALRFKTVQVVVVTFLSLWSVIDVLTFIAVLMLGSERLKEIRKLKADSTGSVPPTATGESSSTHGP